MSEPNPTEILLEILQTRYRLGLDRWGVPWATTIEGEKFALVTKPGIDRLSDHLAFLYMDKTGSLPAPRILKPVVRQAKIIAENSGLTLTEITEADSGWRNFSQELKDQGVSVDKSEVDGVREICERLAGRLDIFVSGHWLNRAVHNDQGRVAIQPIDDPATFANWAEMHGLRFYKQEPFTLGAGSVSSVEEVFCPDKWGARVLRRGEYRNVLSIMGTAAIPVVRSDGTVAAVNGYDPKSNLYLDLDPDLQHLTVPAQPSDRDVEQATKYVLQLLDGFPFGGRHDPEERKGASLANAVGLLLSVPLKSMFPRMLTPMHAVDAGAQGSGKSLLAMFLPGLLAGGYGTVTYTTDESEQRKRLTSEFGRGRRVLSFDNIAIGTVFESAVLAQLITSERWEDRILGGNRMISMPMDKIVTASGNSLRLGPDMIARTVPILLDPPTDQPAKRKFDRRLDSNEVLDQIRPELIKAMLTILVAWAREGRPERQNAPIMRQFSPWAARVGGILQMIGVPHHLANLDEFEAVDPAEEALAFLWAEIADHFRYPDEFTAGDVARLIKDHEAWDEDLPSWIADRIDRDRLTGLNLSKLAQTLGSTFRSHRLQYHGRVRVTPYRRVHNSTRWVAEKLGNTE